MKKIIEKLVKQSTNPIIITEADLQFPGPKIVYINDSFTKMTGYTMEDLHDKSPRVFQGKKSHKIEFDKKKEQYSDGFSFETVNYKKDGTPYHAKINIFPIKDDNENITHYAAIQEDITEHIKEITYLKKFIDLQDNIIILVRKNELLFANKKLFDFSNFDDLAHFKEYHQDISELFIEDERFFNLSKIEQNENWLTVLKTLPHSQRVVTIMGQDFKIHAFSLTVNAFDNDIDIVTFSNISQTVLNQIKLQEKILHDKLTCAFTREYFEQNYPYIIQETKVQNCLFGLAILDIDHFKNVNDTYGHDVGDYVLKTLVKVINKFSREDDILIRWGGEEFIMILKVDSKDSLKSALEHVRKVIELEKLESIGQLTCSFGATIYKNDEDIETTIKRADDALYYSKRTGRNKVTIDA